MQTCKTVFATPLKLGRPFGNLSDRSGLGCARFFRRCFAVIGNSLARDAVPHGGASITASTLPNSNQPSTVFWPSCFVRSTLETGPFTRLLSMIWSIPRASPPQALKAAATPAVPQNKSKRKSCLSDCVYINTLMMWPVNFLMGTCLWKCWNVCVNIAKRLAHFCASNARGQALSVVAAAPPFREAATGWPSPPFCWALFGQNPFSEKGLSGPHSQAPCLWAEMNECRLLHPFLQQTWSPFGQSEVLAHDPRLNAKQ